MRHVLACVLLLMSSPAFGQACGERPKMLDMLASEFFETPYSAALGAEGNVYEVITSSENATWTLLRTLPSGLTCIVAEGQHWQPVPRVVLGPGDPA